MINWNVRRRRAEVTLIRSRPAATAFDLAAACVRAYLGTQLPPGRAVDVKEGAGT